MVEGDTPPVNATALSIRKRYNHGKASNDVAEAGLLVHCFDGTEGADAPWKPCTTGTCNQFQWWWSASFINLVQLANPDPNPKPNPNPNCHMSTFCTGGPPYAVPYLPLVRVGLCRLRLGIGVPG